jgi:hypothetical protein
MLAEPLTLYRSDGVGVLNQLLAPLLIALA